MLAKRFGVNVSACSEGDEGAVDGGVVGVAVAGGEGLGLRDGEARGGVLEGLGWMGMGFSNWEG